MDKIRLSDTLQAKKLVGEQRLEFVKNIFLQRFNVDRTYLVNYEEIKCVATLIDLCGEKLLSHLSAEYKFLNNKNLMRLILAKSIADYVNDSPIFFHALIKMPETKNFVNSGNYITEIANELNDYQVDKRKAYKLFPLVFNGDNTHEQRVLRDLFNFLLKSTNKPSESLDVIQSLCESWGHKLKIKFFKDVCYEAIVRNHEVVNYFISANHLSLQDLEEAIYNKKKNAHLWDSLDVPALEMLAVLGVNLNGKYAHYNLLLHNINVGNKLNTDYLLGYVKETNKNDLPFLRDLVKATNFFTKCNIQSDTVKILDKLVFAIELEQKLIEKPQKQKLKI